jgi:RNA polymerase sigma factor (TIGR02999 family)
VITVESPTPEITVLLQKVRGGDKEAEDRLYPLVYHELRKLAASFMNRERRDHTLRATALVHEAYVRLLGSADVDWRDRSHFFAVAARLMRRILVDYARAHTTQKRGSGAKVDLEMVDGITAPVDEELVALDQVLSRLEALDPRAAKVVELRFFGGLTEEETCKALEIGLTTMKRDWDFARTWMLKQLRSTASE